MLTFLSNTVVLKSPSQYKKEIQKNKLFYTWVILFLASHRSEPDNVESIFSNVAGYALVHMTASWGKEEVPIIQVNLNLLLQ